LRVFCTIRNVPKPVLSVDLGGTKILASVVEGRLILGSAKLKTGKGKPGRVMRQIVDAARLALDEAGVSLSGIEAVGVAVPGAIDPKTGVVLTAPNLGWKDYPAAAKLEEDFGRRVVLANDANAGLAGECAFGALRPYRGRPTAGFFVGTGVGGAFAEDGKVMVGESGAAGEFGHITVARMGRRCGCGRYGCLETFASRSAIERELHVGRGQLRSSQIKKALRKGDKDVRSAVESAADWLGVGIGSIINALNPAAIVVGGGLMEAIGKKVIHRVIASAKKHSLRSAFDVCSIVLSELGDDAVVVGMSDLALQAKR
jgi:glucokinase